MGDRQIWYHIREGFRSIFTHGLMSIAAVCMTVACLLIMGSFSLIAINANHVLGDLEDDNQFLAYIDDSLTRAQAQALRGRMQELEKAWKQTKDPAERANLEGRIWTLEVLWRETRDQAVLLERYYERGYHRNEKYTL